MPTPPPAAPLDSYAALLVRRAPARVRLLAVCAVGACVACVLVEGAYALAGRHPRGFGWADVAAVRAPVAALGLLWVLVARHGHAHRLALPTFAATALSAAIIDWGFYAQGFDGGVAHALLRVFSVIIGMQLLPVTRRGRLAYLGLVTAAHLGLVAAAPGRPDLLPALAFEALVLAAIVTLAFILETHFRSHRRQFELRREAAAALAALEASRSQLLVAGGTLSVSSRDLTGSAHALLRQAESLSAEVDTIARSSERIAASAGDLSARTDASARRAHVAHERAGDIDRVVQALSAGMADVVRAVERSEAQVRELQEHSSSVQAFVDLLREMAEQTHMLGVNASLEAARAGAHGLGFGVVAHEVRRLAAETNRRTGEVSALMAQMAATMQEALGAAVSIGETTQRFQPVLDSARTTLSDIRALVTEQQVDMSASNGEAERQAEDTAGISEACARLRRLVEAHAQTTADVAATVAQLGDLSSRLHGHLPAAAAAA